MADVRIKFIAESQDFQRGVNEANAALSKMEMSGKSLNQAFKSQNIDAITAVLKRDFSSAANNWEEGANAAKLYAQQVKNVQKAHESIDKYSTVGADGVSMFGSVPSADAHKRIDAMRESLDQLFQTEQKGASRAFDADEFLKDMETRGKAISQFGTELESVKKRMSMIADEGQKLIVGGGDPEQIKKLSDEYAKLTKEHDQLSQATNGTGTRIKNLIKNFVSAQLIVWGIRQAFTMLTQGIKNASQSAAEAEQVLQKFLTVFDGFSKATEAVNDLVNEFGLARSSAMDMMATIGDMAYGLGANTKEAAEFADTTSKFIQDLIAFKDIGGDVIEVTQAFMSGAAGNTRNFRQWGSIVKEATVQARLHEKGLDALTGSSLEWAKAQERVAIVMEQQANAIGATEREWDMMLSIQRRLEQQMKTSNEIAGQYINRFLSPIKEGILEIVTAWNLANTAYLNYINGQAGENEGLWKEGNSLDKTMQSYIDARYSSGWGEKASAYSNQKPDSYDGSWSSMANRYKEAAQTPEIDTDKLISEAEDIIERYGAPWEVVIDRINNKMQLPADALDAMSAYFKAREEAIAEEARKAKEIERQQIAAARMLEETEWLNSTFLNMGAIDFSGRDSKSFVDAFSLESILGADSFEGNAKAKMESLFAIAEELNNKLLFERAKGEEADQYFIREWDFALKNVKAGIRNANDELQKLNFDNQREAMFKQLSSLKERNRLETEYGDDSQDIVNIKMQQWKAEQEALRIKNEAVSAGMDETKAESERLSLVASIAEYYDYQLETTLATTKAKREQEEIEKNISRIMEARSTIIDERLENASLRRNLDRSWNESPLEAAKFERGESIEQNKQVMREFIWDDVYTEAQQKIIDAGGSVALSIEQEALMRDKHATLMERTELEYRQKLKDARDVSILDIESMWENIGDVGMVKKWAETFATNKEYYQTEDGGENTEGKASMMAFGDVGMMVLMEFLGKLKSVNELLGMVSTFMDALAPIVDQFLAPLMLIIDPLLSILGDLLLPALQHLFPVIQVLATGLIYLLAVVKTVTNAISWLQDTIYVAIWNIIHPFRQKDYRNLADETEEIWADANERVAEIWEMEIDARMDYVSELTEAQKGELKAYEEMYKNGLLSFSEFEALVQSNLYNRPVDRVSYSDYVNGGATSLGTSVSMGTVNITVNAGTTSDPAELARRVSAELAKIGRRGGSYAVA